DGSHDAAAIRLRLLEVLCDVLLDDRKRAPFVDTLSGGGLAIEACQAPAQCRPDGWIDLIGFDEVGQHPVIFESPHLDRVVERGALTVKGKAPAYLNDRHDL